MPRRRAVRGLAVLTVAAVPALASAEERSVHWQEFLHFTRVEAAPVFDRDGHVLLLWAMAGLAVFPDGEVAVVRSVGTSDNVPGDPTYRGYVLYRFDDGSTEHARLQGRITGPYGAHGNTQEGSFTLLDGTGRFAGIGGGGTYTGTQYTPTEAGGHTLISVTGRLTTGDP